MKNATPKKAAAKRGQKPTPEKGPTAFDPSAPLSKQECENALQFLDRVAVTGHQERLAMNNLVAKLFHQGNAATQ